MLDFIRNIVFILAVTLISFQAKVFQYSHPISPQAGQIIERSQYTLSYNCEHEQANWVSYVLERAEIMISRERTNDFRSDTRVACQSAALQDYKKSGYDRGHLCPAADSKITHESMSESFFMSNISPMLPNFNRNSWLKLEKQTREWAIEKDEIIVITGPVLKEGLSAIGTNRVSIPEYFYKILFCPATLEYVAFLLPHSNSYIDYRRCNVSIDSIEAVTGIDFFPQSGLEELEAQVFEW